MRGGPVIASPAVATATIMLLLLSMFALAAANPDPVKLFEKIAMPEQELGRSDFDSIKSVLQDQGVVLAEATFDSSLGKTRCMARELCKFGAEGAQHQFGEAVSVFTEFLQGMVDTTERETTNIDSLLGAVEVS